MPATPTLFSDTDASTAVGASANESTPRQPDPGETMERLSQLELLLRGYSFSFTNEEELQTGIATMLGEAGIDYKREVHLSARDRIDFLVDAIGIEVKVGGSMANVTRQLHRYSECVSISALILVTSRIRHGLGLPDEMNGKPLRVHAIVAML